jgi:hypothetical protein
VYYRDSDFIGKIQVMIKNDYEIKGKTITIRKPQENAVVD